MSSSVSELWSSLEQLSHDELHQSNRTACRRSFDSEWTLAVHLLATQRSGLFRRKGCGSAVAYAVRYLNLQWQKAGELLSTAQVFEHLPLISEAVRQGKLCWSKARSLKRVTTPDNELGGQVPHQELTELTQLE